MKRPLKKYKKGQVKRSPVHQSFVHKAHTGKLVHKSNTHYPALAFLMLICGILMLGVTFKAHAANVQVTATVLGEPPATAATIDVPKNGQHFKSIPIDVSGTCPLESYVRIYKNDVFAGSIVCSATGDYTLKIDLFVGKNTLVARVYNNANVEGPISDQVVVYYDKPVNVPPITPAPTSSSGKPGKTITQLYISSDIVYKGFYVNQEISWPVEIGGGVGPYAVSVNWGDGNSDVYSLKSAGIFNVKHMYSKPGGIRGSYNVVIQASDSQGGKAYLQIVLLVNNLKIATTSGSINSGVCDPTSVGLTSAAEPTLSVLLLPSECKDILSYWKNLYTMVLLMWPFYIVALLMFVSFWLGERREFNLLLAKRRIRRAH